MKLDKHARFIRNVGNGLKWPLRKKISPESFEEIRKHFKVIANDLDKMNRIIIKNQKLFEDFL